MSWTCCITTKDEYPSCQEIGSYPPRSSHARDSPAMAYYQLPRQRSLPQRPLRPSTGPLPIAAASCDIEPPFLAIARMSQAAHAEAGSEVAP